MPRPLISSAKAYDIASQWGSYMNGSDPGACFYGFHSGDGRPASEAHRALCLAYGADCLAIAKARVTQGEESPSGEVEQDVCDLEDLLRFFRKARVRP